MLTEAEEQSIVLQAIGWLAEPTHLVTSLTLFVALWCAYNVTLHPLARVPGPLVARLGLPGGVWPFWQALRYDYAWSLERAHDRYGPAVRIARAHVSFSSTHAAQQIYAHGAGATFPKTTFYRSFQVYPTAPSLFSEIVPAQHAAFRRAISHAYSMNSLVKLEEYIEPLVARFAARITQQDGETVNMARWLHYFAMDAVGELAFGDSFGFVARGQDEVSFLAGVSNLSRWGGAAGWLPVALSQPCRALLKRVTRQPGGEVVGRATEPLLNKRYAALDAAHAKGVPSVEREDMLANFIDCTHPSSGNKLTKREVLRTAISVVAAGSDTTATALTAFFAFLVRDEADVYADLQREIDTAFDEGALHWPVKYAEAVKLPLLQACIKETLRLHPPISMSLPRFVADKAGAVIPFGGGAAATGEADARSSLVVPQGCQVSVSPYVLHRDKRIFGPGARTYNPRRWLGIDDHRRRELERANLSFGGGARQCIGKNISLMEINKALPTLLRLFDFKLPDKAAGLMRRDADGRWGRDKPLNCQATWFHEITELPLVVSRRKDMEMPDEVV